MFPILRCFSGTFNSVNNLIRHSNTLWKAAEIVSESEIVLREVIPVENLGKPGNLEISIKSGKLPVETGDLKGLGFF